MFSRVNLDDLELRSIDDLDQRVKAVGYELQPEAMRPNVWVFEEGDTGNRHYHHEQEELSLVLDGRFRLEIGDETLELEAEDIAVVSSEEWRQVTALEDGTLFGRRCAEHRGRWRSRGRVRLSRDRKGTAEPPRDGNSRVHRGGPIFRT